VAEDPPNVQLVINCFFSQLNPSKLINEFVYLFEEAANEIFCE